MSNYPQQPVDAFDICDLALRHYRKVLQRTWPLMVFITLSQAFSFYMGHLFTSVTLNVICDVIGLLFFLYFCAAMLYQVQSVLDTKSIDFKQALAIVKTRYLPFVITLFCIVAVVVLYYWFISHMLQIWVGNKAQASQMKSLLIFLFLCLAPIVIFVVFMIFSPILVLLDKVNPLAAFKDSYLLIGMRWIQAFTVYACLGVVYILVAPGTLHAHFLMHYYLFIPFVFVVYLILLPLVFNYVLFMLHDFKLRFASEQDLL